LVDRAKAPGGLFENVKAALDCPFEGDVPLAEWVSGIYVNWEPDGELDGGQGVYQVRLLFVCDGSVAENKLGELLSSRLEQFQVSGVRDGVSLVWDAKARATTFITDLDGYHRLSEWDYLTNLGRSQERSTHSISARGLHDRSGGRTNQLACSRMFRQN